MPPLLLVIDLQRPWPNPGPPGLFPGNGRIAALHDRFFELVGSSNECPPAWLDGEWWHDRRLDPLRPEFAAARAEIAASDFPMVSDPRLAFTLPLWRAADTKSHCLIWCGAPWTSELAAGEATVLARWEAFHAAALRHSQGIERRIWYQPDPATAGAAVSLVESWLAPRRLPAGFIAAVHAAPDPAQTDPGNGRLTPSQARLLRGLEDMEREGAPDPAVSGATLTAALRSAGAQLEQSLFDQTLVLHERMGRSRQAVETASREVMALERKLSELEDRRSELERQLAIAVHETGELRNDLKTRLGDWCALDEALDAGERIRETLRTIDAVRSSWTWRFARLLTWPTRVVHRLYLAVLSWRRAEPT